MGRALKVELKRAFNNNVFRIVILFGCFIAVAAFFTTDGFKMCRYWLDYVNGKISYEEASMWRFMDTPLEIWMPVDGVSGKFYNTWLTILPVLCALPYATTYFSDRKKGLINQLITRMGKTNYYLSKLIVSFISGGTVAVIPLIVNLMLCMCFLPWGMPLVSSHNYVVTEGAIFFELFYTYPALYVVMYLLITFVLFGLLNALCVILAHIIENKFALLMSTFILYYGEHSLIGFTTGKFEFSLLSNARIFFIRQDKAWILCVTLLMLVLINLLILLRVRKDVL